MKKPRRAVARRGGERKRFGFYRVRMPVVWTPPLWLY
jgi:hypothetical protein